MKLPYDRRFRPPFPTLPVRLYSSVTDTFGDSVTALVDTGSDATLVPLSYLVAIGAEETAPGWLVSITGERKPVSLYFVDVHIDELALAGIRVMADRDAEDVILGRDVLNKLPLFLDGPQASLSVLDDRMTARLRRG